MPDSVLQPLDFKEFSFQYAGKLLLRKEILLNEPSFQQLLANNLLTAKKSIIQKNFHYQCQRCGNENPHLFAKLPCQRCHHTHRYCRKCIEMGRVSECELLYYWNGTEPDWSYHVDPCSWKGKLTVVQQKAADRIVDAVQQKESELLVWAVCGAGKTEMLFPGITEALSTGKRICLATPRADVVRELLPRLQSAFQAVSIQALYGGSEDKLGAAQLIIATTHQLLRYQKAFDVMIIDEIDAFPYHADKSLPYAAKRSKKSQSTTIYLTATPRKEHKKAMRRKKLPHIFVPVRFHGQPLPIPKKVMCHGLNRDLNTYFPPSAFLKWVKSRKNPKRQLLIFVPSITLAENIKPFLSMHLRKVGILLSEEKLQSVHAADVDREEKVQAFRAKEIFILITTTILERGVTFPSVDVAIFDAGHDVFDEAALVQIAGRAGRSPDDPTGEVLFFHDGKTEAMVQAIDSIKSMNKRGEFLK
ncbi:DEAD/DEAH box helicase [Oceanobacillus sp. CF4.6]|uniref:DEAD/DEAH box helicase n=1 Tax=Oceanobacillus sp. CF4.6 TaxID=3373080 RepID=UPI003EE434D7